jgi:MFS family permease
VIESPAERAAVYVVFTVIALEAALNFAVPLNIQIVQDRTPIETAIAMLPFNLTVFFAAMLIVRLYDRLTPHTIGRLGIFACTVVLLWLAWVVHNDWSAVPVLIGLVVFGIGQGSLVTLVFNVLVTTSPKELAGDVGTLRGTTNYLAAALGMALAGALLVGLSSAAVLRSVAGNAHLPPTIRSEVDLDSISFVSNDRLLTIMQGTTATPEQVIEAVRANTDARLRALEIGFRLMAGLAMLAIFPAGRLPNDKPGEIPANPATELPEGAMMRAKPAT